MCGISLLIGGVSTLFPHHELRQVANPFAPHHVHGEKTDIEGIALDTGGQRRYRPPTRPRDRHFGLSKRIHILPFRLRPGTQAIALAAWAIRPCHFLIGGQSARRAFPGLVEGNGCLPQPRALVQPALPGASPWAGHADHDHRRDPCVRRADPAIAARRPAFGQLDRGRGCALDDAGDRYASGVQRIPDHSSDHHADPAGLERRDGAPGAHARWNRRSQRGGRSHPGVRVVCGRRSGDRRRDPVSRSWS